MSMISDPSIDPITGLPALNPSGPVQQIPLGAQVFPYADLNATAQPTRGPIYGDDIIPTSSLITAPDAQMKPRSVQATTTRELRVREAVFQNLGAAIPDGTTAPVDVNVVSGGGGGGGITHSPYQLLSVENVAGVTSSNYRASFTTGFKIQGFRYSLALAPGDNNTDKNIWIRFFAFDQHSSDKWDLMVDTLYCDNANAVFKPIVQGYISWNPLWDLLATLITPQVSPIVFGFQLGGAGGLSLGGGFDLYYLDI